MFSLLCIMGAGDEKKRMFFLKSQWIVCLNCL